MNECLCLRENIHDKDQKLKTKRSNNNRFLLCLKFLNVKVYYNIYTKKKLKN